MPLAFNLLRCLRQRSILRPQEFRRRTGLEQAHCANDSKRTEEEGLHLSGFWNPICLAIDPLDRVDLMLRMYFVNQSNASAPRRRSCAN